MFNLFDSVTDLVAGADAIRRHRYGVITVVAGQLESVRFRPWPKLISAAEISWFGSATHNRNQADRCELFYNQPLAHSNFLALKYVVSNLGTSYRSFRKTLLLLDQIACIKRTDALLSEIANQRISDRFLTRMGWEQHLESSRKRHFIKRFYGDYPEHAKLPLSEVAPVDQRESAA